MTNFVLGLVGSVVLILGVFMPIVRVPIFGSMNYVNNGKGDGVIVLLFALVSLFLVMRNEYQWLFLTGFGVLGTMALTFINISKVLAKTNAGVKMFVQFDWAWGVLLLGAIMLITAAIIEPKRTLPKI